MYDYFGLNLTSHTEAAMREWLAANPANRLGEHRYTGAEFGLDPKEVRERFRPYMEHYGLT
jgi:hypothetical protein